MASGTRRFVCWVGLVCLMGGLAQSASALDTPNVLMAIDGMTLNHQGLFRSGTPADGFNTFSFGPFATVGAFTEVGRYKAFHFLTTGVGDKGISHNARNHSDTPEHWNGSAYQIPDRSGAPLDLTSDYFPAIDRSFGGQIFDPAEYQIEVKFKPNLDSIPGIFNNTAPLFTVGLDQLDGFVWDAEVGAYKRANDAFIYNIGSAELPLNDWYAAAPKDTNGYATFTVPVSSPNFVQRGFYFKYGDGTFRTNDVVTGLGRVFNTETQVWDDVNDGMDPLSFGGGATDPARPGSQLEVPNGVPLISFGAPAAETGLSVEINYIALKKINPGPIVSRIDANSGFTFRFGSGFARSTTAAPIPIPGDAYGLGYVPAATDQISRFDENGMTNLILNMRTPDNANETHRFVLRGGPNAESFDGSDPEVMVNVRAKLLPGNTVPTMTIVAKDLDGNDCNSINASQGCSAVDMVGGDEYTFNLDLSQFNSSTFTTVSVPLSAFTLSTFVPPAPPNGSVGPFGFNNPGDGLRSNFNLYEFAGLIAPDTGLLKMELEYMEIRLPDDGVPGDFDEDGDVDGRDFLVWQRGGSPTPLSATDLATWQANYGTGGLAAVGSVPEPGAALLAITCSLALLAGRKRL
jgi:hypothetical protein